MSRRWSLGRALGWAVLAVLVAAAMIAPLQIRLPEPEGARVVDTARYALGGSPAQTVSLPHSWPTVFERGPLSATYELTFALDAVPAEPLFLLVPAARQSLGIALNGTPLFSDTAETFWNDPAAGGTALVRLAPRLLVQGENVLTLTLKREAGVVPGFLSRLFLGSEAEIVPNYRLRTLFADQFKAMVLAAHLLIIVGVVAGYVWRRQDVVFQWLALLAASSLIVAITEIPAFGNLVGAWRPFFFIAASSTGLIVLGLALALAELRRPVWLKVAIGALPTFGLIAALVAPQPAGLIVVGMTLPVSVVCVFIAAAILIWGATRHGDVGAGLLAVPLFITGWYYARDIAIIAGWMEGAFLLFPYVRPLTVGAVMILLMHRLAVSLNRLDNAHETLLRRLGEQQEELSRLHEKERIRTADAVREEERQRLMRDLHDGLSGNLVSIIALAEQPEPERAAIEQAAREALDDLRLVINSLDIGDRDLPLALASFRERLAPRLRRVGVELDWSMEQLPEVSGVTPSSALAVLRILQEGVTNALKHGPARRIAIRGVADGDAAIITLENDGAAHSEAGTGHGLANMRRRAEALGGRLGLEPAANGAVMRLSLALPLSLPAAL